MLKKTKILDYLQIVAPILPTPIYWQNKDGLILGANDLLLKAIDISRENYVDKNLYEIYPQPIAEDIKKHDDIMIEKGEILSHETKIQTIFTDKTKYFHVIKAPLRDDEGNIIGIVSTLTDITIEKEKIQLSKGAEILQYLELVAPSLPAPIYWLDLNGVIVGGNEALFLGTGALSKEAMIGRTAYDLYPKKMANHIVEHNRQVIETGKILSQEEIIEDITTGTIKYCTAIKAPLRNNDGDIIGIIGTSIDITQQKEAERLKLEHEIQLQQQEKFTKIANQVAHDIRSPLSSLTMIVKACTQIPEGDRIALREAATAIGDIANHLLYQYQKKDKTDASESEERQPILVSVALLESLSAKKYQYENCPIKFDSHFKSHSHFAFIKIGPSAFKRMLSNLINNAVDAFDNQPGKIDLSLETDNEWVKVIIQDTGKGMAPELIDKIMHKTAVTEGKKSGHGIGLTQVWETLERNQGEMHIASEQDKGTTVTLTFPRVRAPYWIAEEIALSSNDTVIILDDDTSIHGAWRARFEGILNENRQIQLKHFQVGLEALEFIHSLAPGDKMKVFLLSDYELLKQELNGLHVIAQSGIQRSILVTSHYANPEVQKEAAKTGTKILPKQLASEIVIKINLADAISTNEASIETVAAIIVDDDKSFVEDLVLYAFDDDEIVAEYYNPENFLQNVDKYPKDTKIYLDNNYATSELKGLDVAQELHQLGYTQIYLLSGEVFGDDDIPSYVTLIGKNNIEKLRKL